VRCDECNMEMELNDLDVHLATYRCLKCGKSINATISFAVPSVTHATSRVLITWDAVEPTVKELNSLRKLLPSLQNTRIVDVVARAKQLKVWDCGAMAYGHAIDLIDAAKKLGLKAYLLDENS